MGRVRKTVKIRCDYCDCIVEKDEETLITYVVFDWDNGDKLVERFCCSSCSKSDDLAKLHLNSEDTENIQWCKKGGKVDGE